MPAGKTSREKSREPFCPISSVEAPLGNLVHEFRGIVPQGSNRHCNESIAELRDHQRSTGKCLLWSEWDAWIPAGTMNLRLGAGFAGSHQIGRTRKALLTRPA